MKHRIAVVASSVLAAIATVVMTSASSALLYRPQVPAELQRKQ